MALQFGEKSHLTNIQIQLDPSCNKYQYSSILASQFIDMADKKVKHSTTQNCSWRAETKTHSNKPWDCCSTDYLRSRDDVAAVDEVVADTLWRHWPQATHSHCLSPVYRTIHQPAVTHTVYQLHTSRQDNNRQACQPTAIDTLCQLLTRCVSCWHAVSCW